MIKPALPTHLATLTDDFGVWQFHNGQEVLREHGYALDDAARSLIVFLLYGEKSKAAVCLQYLEHSLKDGQLVGFFDENRKATVFPSSEDALALSLWALAFAVTQGFEKERAEKLLLSLDRTVINTTHNLRPKCYALIAFSLLGDSASAKPLAQTLIAHFAQDPNWDWFEEQLTYANAILPYALVLYGQSFEPNNQELKEIVRKGIATLERYMRVGVIPSPVGNREWHVKHRITRDIYGQQGIDAGFMVLLLTAASKWLQDTSLYIKAGEWMEWFYGNNIFHANLITKDFACADGIDEIGPKPHYGAESTLIYLWANHTYLAK